MDHYGMTKFSTHQASSIFETATIANRHKAIFNLPEKDITKLLSFLSSNDEMFTRLAKAFYRKNDISPLVRVVSKLL